MTKIKDLPNFPKKKEAKDPKTPWGNLKVGDLDKALQYRKEIGCNQTLEEVGNIEVGVPSDYPNVSKVLNSIYRATYRKGGSAQERREMRISVLEKALYQAYRRGQFAERNIHNLIINNKGKEVR